MSHFYPPIFNILEQQGVLWLACELAVNCGFNPGREKQKDDKIGIFAACGKARNNQGVRSKTGWTLCN